MGYDFKSNKSYNQFTGGSGTLTLLAPSAGQIQVIKSLKMRFDNNHTGTPTWTATLQLRSGSSIIILDTFTYAGAGAEDEMIEYAWNTTTASAGNYLNTYDIILENGDVLELVWSYSAGVVTGSVDVSSWISGSLKS